MNVLKRGENSAFTGRIMLKMMINTLYFSATDTTKKVVNGIANKIAENIGGEPTSAAC